MHNVYLIRSTAFVGKTYIGFTHDLKQRMATRNAGSSKHTAKYKPWELVRYHAFKGARIRILLEVRLRTGLR